MYVNYWKLDLLSKQLFVDECLRTLCSQTSLLVRCLLLVCWRIIGCLCLLAGASLVVAGNAECITLETSQDWLRMLVCHMVLYREAVFTARVAGTVSVVATGRQRAEIFLGRPLIE